MDAPGLLADIWVDDFDGTLAAVTIHGDEVMEGLWVDVEPTGAWTATFRDLAGNLIGRCQQGPAAAAFRRVNDRSLLRSRTSSGSSSPGRMRRKVQP